MSSTPPARDVVRLVCAGVLTVVLFPVLAVLFLVLVSGSLADTGAADSLGAIVLYDALTILAAAMSLWTSLLVTRRLGTPAMFAGDPLELDGPRQSRPLGLLAVALVPALVGTLAQVSSRGAGALRFLLLLLALVAVGVGVVLHEDRRVRQDSRAGAGF